MQLGDVEFVAHSAACTADALGEESVELLAPKDKFYVVSFSMTTLADIDSSGKPVITTKPKPCSVAISVATAQKRRRLSEIDDIFRRCSRVVQAPGIGPSADLTIPLTKEIA